MTAAFENLKRYVFEELVKEMQRKRVDIPEAVIRNGWATFDGTIEAGVARISEQDLYAFVNDIAHHIGIGVQLAAQDTMNEILRKAAATGLWPPRSN